MMKKSKLDYISKKQILIATALVIVLIFVPFVFISCISESIAELAEGGVKFNKVIYAINPEDYFDGRTPVEDVYNKYGEEIYYQTYSNLYFLETDKSGVYDMLIGPSDDLGLMLSATQSTNLGYSSPYGSEIQCPIFDNNYIFSGIHQMFEAGGQWECSDHNCVCGPRNYDMGDNCWVCACQTYPGQFYEKSITVESELTKEKILENLEIKCEVCNSYDTVINEDGTITYSKTLICSHDVLFNHDGTFADIRKKYFGNSNPRELIIDGFDFSYMHEYITNFNYFDGYKGEWFVRCQPESYNHMFSDLSVEKITIKNITGLGDRAKDLSSMFENCPNLRTVEFGNLFEGCQPTNISRMFYNCPKLEYVDLSSLDTSCVTDMSEMFALSGNSLTAKSRDQEIERLINKHIQEDEELAVFNDGTIYTIDSLIEKLNEIYAVTLTKGDLCILLVELGESIPLTYDEYCNKTWGTDLVGVYNLALQDPTQFGLTVKEDGTPYDIYEIIELLEETALSEGIDVIHEMELQDNKSRDDILNFFINHTLVPIYVDEYDIIDVNQSYTIDMIAYYFDVPRELIVCEIVYKLIEAQSIVIPVSYNEALYYSTNGEITFDELVTELLKSQDEELPPKEDGSKYTRTEIKEMIKTELDSEAIEYGLIVVEDKEIENFYSIRPATAKTLILGGEGSKFVVKNGTDVTNMFGTSSIFKEIVTPNEIGDEIEIVLSNRYTETKIPDGTPVEDESVFVLTLSSEDENKTYFSYSETKEEIEPPVENPSNENISSITNEEMQIRKYFVMAVFATLILSIVIITIRILVKLDRRRRIRRFI